MNKAVCGMSESSKGAPDQMRREIARDVKHDHNRLDEHTYTPWA